MQNLIPTDKEDAIKKDIASLQDRVKTIIVTDDASVKGASEFLGQIKLRLKRLKELRMELTKPFKDAVKNADNWFKTQEVPLEQMEFSLKQAIGKYMEAVQKKAEEEARKAEKARREAEEEARKKAAEAEKKGEPVPEPDAPSVPAEPVERPKTNVQTEAGNVVTSKVWTWEITDEEKVPRKYLKVNDAEITKAVRDGSRRIPGIKIFQKTSVSVR